MNDRELLEAAAKAAGLDAEFHPELGYGPEGMWLKGARSPDNSKYWNPLVSDGDALRLACKLKLNIAQGDFSAGVDDEAEVAEAALVRNDDERPAVIRRLIVTAAAAMATK